MHFDSYGDFQITNKEIPATHTPHSSQELYNFLCIEYIHNGYLYSGSWADISLKEKGFYSDSIEMLLAAGLIQKRNCDGLIYELTPDIRKKLIAKYSLCSDWYEKVGEPLLYLIQNELRDSSGIGGSASQLSIGQVIALEYDKQSDPSSWLTNHTDRASLIPKNVGNFMVTDVILNRLTYPHVNMVELQSLCPEFNYLYPHDRSMLLFEDAVINRIRIHIPNP